MVWVRVRQRPQVPSGRDGGGDQGRSLGAGRAGVPGEGSGTSANAAAAGSMASTALEIIAFVVSISGWVLVSSTLPTDYWKVSTIDGTVITTATYFANLWKMCVTDSTGVANCKDFPSMLALDGLHPFGTHPHPFPLLAGASSYGPVVGPPGGEARPYNSALGGSAMPAVYRWLSCGASSELGNPWW